MKKITLLLFISLIICTFSVSAVSTLPISGTLSPTMPTDWTYVSNDPTGFPNPSFYTTVPGLKINFEKMGVISPEFNAQSSVKVTLTVAQLNANTKTGTNADYFTITGLNSTGTVVATSTLKSVVVGDNNTTLTGVNIVKVSIIMTGYPNNGTAFCNVNLGSVSISANPSGIASLKADILDVTMAGNKLTVTNSPSSTVEIFNTVGAKVQSVELTNNSADLNLGKGLYIVRVGGKSAKIRL